MTRLWTVVYDIADPRRLRRVAKIMEGYGERVQLSVFECTLTNDSLAELRRRICMEIDTDADSVRWYPLCAWCADRVTWQGFGDIVDDSSYIIV